VEHVAISEACRHGLRKTMRECNGNCRDRRGLAEEIVNTLTRLPDPFQLVLYWGNLRGCFRPGILG